MACHLGVGHEGYRSKYDTVKVPAWDSDRGLIRNTVTGAIFGGFILLSYLVCFELYMNVQDNRVLSTRLIAIFVIAGMAAVLGAAFNFDKLAKIIWGEGRKQRDGKLVREGGGDKCDEKIHIEMTNNVANNGEENGHSKSNGHNGHKNDRDGLNGGSAVTVSPPPKPLSPGPPKDSGKSTANHGYSDLKLDDDDEDDVGGGSFEVTNGRPNFDFLLDLALEGATGSRPVKVFVCGPEAMKSEIKQKAAVGEGFSCGGEGGSSCCKSKCVVPKHGRANITIFEEIFEL